MKSRFLTWTGIIIILFLIITTVRSIAGLWFSGEWMDRKVSEVDKIRQENEKIIREIEKATSAGQIEKGIREKLDMVLPGETILLLPEDLLASNSGEKREKPVPNWEKWVRRIF